MLFTKPRAQQQDVLGKNPSYHRHYWIRGVIQAGLFRKEVHILNGLHGKTFAETPSMISLQGENLSVRQVLLSKIQ